MKTTTACIEGQKGEYLEAWVLARGEVPMEPHAKGDPPTRRMALHHVCRQGNCINLQHIVAVTAQEHALLHRRMMPAA